MALLPIGEGGLQAGVGHSLQAGEKDLIDKQRAAISRGQEGRGCKLSWSPIANPSSTCRERSLEPCAVITKAHVGNLTQSDLRRLS